MVTSDVDLSAGQIVFDPSGNTHGVSLSCSPAGAINSTDFVVQLERKALTAGEMTQMHIGVNSATIPQSLATSSGTTCNGSYSYSYGYISGGIFNSIGTVTVPIILKIAEYLPPIAVKNIQNLNFGTVFGNNPITDDISSTVPSAIFSTRNARKGIFEIVKEDAGTLAVAVTLTPFITMSGPAGPASTYINITSNPPVESIAFINQGTTTINVGGTLHILGNEIAGTYTGTYVLTINY